MRAVDTNVLLRYFLNDVPEQAKKARQLVDSDQHLGLTVIVLAEIAWTLVGPRYRRDRGRVARLLGDLLARDNIVPIGFDKAEAQAALLTCAAEVGAANFGDAFIAATARSAGLQEIYSFDQRFARAGLTPLTPP